MNKNKEMKMLMTLTLVAFIMIGCGSQNGTKIKDNDIVILDVEATHFTQANANTAITMVPCTLSDGTKAECFQIVTNSAPTDHQMGPWCPDNVYDDARAGGIWLNDGKVYDVDGAFIKNMASFYNDKNWKMYDANGNIYVTETEEDCINAANPNVGEEYKNFCVECLPSYITNVSRTHLIPVTPVLTINPSFFMRGRQNDQRDEGQGEVNRPPGGERPPGGNRPPRGDRPERDGPPPSGERPERGRNNIPSTRGIALNGVEFSAPAPVNNILSAYTIAPFDDAGGHINVHQGYHYHAATGVSFSIVQNDGHAPLIGYAIDGHGIYARMDENGTEAKDLDECRGHYDDVRGYHYHVDAPGKNNFINCLKGAFVIQ